MDAIDWSGGPPPVPAVRPGFAGSVGAMAPIVFKGVFLTVVTLGLYRFWYVTSVRRFLWGATEVDGDPLEYSGRGVELFVGFLIALAVVVPLSGAVNLVGLQAGAEAQALIQPIYSLALLVLAQYARFRARRYRLTRTLWRGVRFQQSGSGWAYAWMSIGWAMAAFISLGLAYPFMRASLERYKMENTFYGDQQGAFSGGGWDLMKKGVLVWAACWILIVLPFAAAAAFGYEMNAGHLTRQQAGVGAAAAFGVSVVSALTLFPVFFAIEFRWWAGGCRIGAASVACDLGLSAFLKAYVAFAAMALLAVAVFGGAVAALFFALHGGGLRGPPGPGFMASAALLYFSGALTLAALWQLFGARAIWKKSFESCSIFGLGELLAAQSLAPPANAFGEGIGDALDFGGF